MRRAPQDALFAVDGDLDAPALAHRDDPETSAEAAASVAPVLRGHRLRVLQAYAGPFARTRGLTDDEAGEVAGLERHEARRRASELRDLRYVAATDERRVLASGRRGVVCRITPAGDDALGLVRRRR